MQKEALNAISNNTNFSARWQLIRTVEELAGERVADVSSLMRLIQNGYSWEVTMEKQAHPSFEQGGELYQRGESIIYGSEPADIFLALGKVSS